MTEKKREALKARKEARKQTIRASAKNLPISPSKVRPIANCIRKKTVVNAVAILNALPHKGARYLSKLIKSAAANAQYMDENIDQESLRIAELLVDGGPVRKSIWPRSRGRADRQIKRSSHIFVLLDKEAVS